MALDALVLALYAVTQPPWVRVVPVDGHPLAVMHQCDDQTWFWFILLVTPKVNNDSGPRNVACIALVGRR